MHEINLVSLFWPSFNVISVTIESELEGKSNPVILETTLLMILNKIALFKHISVPQPLPRYSLSKFQNRERISFKKRHPKSIMQSKWTKRSKLFKRNTLILHISKSLEVN